MLEVISKNFGQVILAISAIVAIFLLFKNMQRIRNFLSEVTVELGKVSWATREELLTATWVVIFSTAVLAVFIFVVDSVLSKLLSLMVK